ncbi:MAG TPA: ABC transporter ATP-binding protein [Rhodospirillales bacterium]|jgi:lipoprotein-releasing system ATP-binding protein|nr:ABC transporter ATP-binding protein [Rhodospirillales bacterium]
MSEAINGDAALALVGVVRAYRQGRTSVEVLRGVDISVRAGEIVALVGQSGAGKSTLLHLAGLLEPADDGSILIAGEDTGGMNDDARTRVRRNNIGFVYQYHHLLPEFSALENIVVPQIIAGLGRREARGRAMELLSALGLADRAKHRPGMLSGGEQQRVAIARALANAPRILLADEPTGNLDPETADNVFAVLLQLTRGAGLAALVATHNRDLASRMDRILFLDQGVVSERKNPRQ